MALGIGPNRQQSVGVTGQAAVCLGGSAKNLRPKEVEISSITDLSGRAADVAAARLQALSLVPETLSAPSRLALVEAAFDVFDTPDSALAIASARQRARALHAAGGAGAEADAWAALGFAAEALTGVMLERTWPREVVA